MYVICSNATCQTKNKKNSIKMVREKSLMWKKSFDSIKKTEKKTKVAFKWLS